jgi:cardiolipin synthase
MEIYEFKEGILHAKIAVADACWTSIGSYNLNFLSAFESLELNLDIADAPFALQVTAELETILETRCERILPEVHPLRQTLVERIGNALAFVALWLTAYVVSFFDRRKERT